MRDLALGYYLTRNTTYATLAIQILVSYSIFYPALPYRDINERAGSSGGRLLSQTLDESNIIPDIAVTFDIVYDRYFIIIIYFNFNFYLYYLLLV